MMCVDRGIQREFDLQRRGKRYQVRHLLSFELAFLNGVDSVQSYEMKTSRDPDETMVESGDPRCHRVEHPVWIKH